MIYWHLFTSTRLTSGYRIVVGPKIRRTKPASNSLAILRTCRLIKQEAEGLWLGQVLFNFFNPEDMLNKLSELPPTALSQIRHVRVGGDSVVLTPIDDEYSEDEYYRFVWAIKLLPGLCLDTLTVLGPSTSNGILAYDTLDGLIKHGNGWKELRFITRYSDMFAFEKMDPYRRRPQPSTWNDILIQRDGLDSGASVTIYRSTQCDAPGAVLNPETRQLFEQKPPSSPEDLEKFGVEEDKQLLDMTENGKAFLVVVKRGRQAQILEQVDPAHFHERDIRHWARDMTWTEIRRECLQDRPRTDDGPLGKPENTDADRYDDVDEWDPANYM